MLGSVTSSLVAVSSIGIMSGIMSCHHCPIITVFQLHAFQFSSFQLARSIDNAVVAVLLTVALASLFVLVVGLLVFSLVVGLLVFSLVELTGSAVVELAVLEFSSIVEILSLPFHSHHLFQRCKKGEQLSPTVTNILPTLLPLLLLSLLSLILNYSASCKSSKESCH